MDLTAGLGRVNRAVVDDSLSTLYPHDLNMYKTAPFQRLSLREFQDIAFDRLKLLRTIEQASFKNHRPYTEEWRNTIKHDLQQQGLKKFVRLMNGYNGNSELDYQARRVDHISHYILRIAYCRSEELRRWFLSRELEWFRIRFTAQSVESIKKFLSLNKLSYIPISEVEKKSLRTELINSAPMFFHFENTAYYKVPIDEVCSLVSGRKVYLKKGLAYVPSFDLVICIMSRFRAHLSEALTWYNHCLPRFDDDRVKPLLENLHRVHTGNNYAVRDNLDRIDPCCLDAYSKKHFPLCMRYMHETLRAQHHHKHSARLTYGLFLKGIGLLYEDAVRFWREEFTRKMDIGKFEKEYLYNIKHLYGKVGRMLNYSPYSCIKIILTNLGPGEVHGCPFKTWDPAIIKQKLIEYGISTERANEIKTLVSAGHYQVACGKYFEASHGKPAPNGINHPNQYFADSIALEKGKKENKK